MILQLKQQKILSSTIFGETNRLVHAEHKYVFEISVSLRVFKKPYCIAFYDLGPVGLHYDIAT